MFQCQDLKLLQAYLKWVWLLLISNISSPCLYSNNDIAFGILLWEIATYGSSPYPGVELQHVYEKLERGYRMERPEGCPADVYKLMLKCWEWKATDRPSFIDLQEEMNNMFQNSSISEEVEKSLHRRREPPMLPAKQRGSRKGSGDPDHHGGRGGKDGASSDTSSRSYS